MSQPIPVGYTNPFVVNKPFSKHPTSSWPLFSDYLDEKIGLYSAPLQYAFYGLGAALVFTFGKQTLRARHLRTFKSKSVVELNHINSNLANTGSARFFAASAVFTGFSGLWWCGSSYRSEEVDRYGDRFKELVRITRYHGLDDEIGSLLARDIVSKSKTRDEGLEMMKIAIPKLLETQQSQQK